MQKKSVPQKQKNIQLITKPVLGIKQRDKY